MKKAQIAFRTTALMLLLPFTTYSAYEAVAQSSNSQNTSSKQRSLPNTSLTQNTTREEVLKNTSWQVVPGARVGKNPADTLIDINNLNRQEKVITFDITGYQSFYYRLQGDCSTREVRFLRRGLLRLGDKVNYQLVDGEEATRVVDFHRTVLDFACKQSNTQIASSPAGSSSSKKIPEGIYWVGTTGMALEVKGGQYQYRDEETTTSWKPISELTPIKDGVLKAGETYWCLSTLPKPQNSRLAVCSASGWTVSPPIASQPSIATPVKPSTSTTLSAPTNSPVQPTTVSSIPQPPSGSQPSSIPQSPPPTPQLPSNQTPSQSPQPVPQTPSPPTDQPPSSPPLPQQPQQSQTPSSPQQAPLPFTKPGDWLGQAPQGGAGYYPDANSACESLAKFRGRTLKGVTFFYRYNVVFMGVAGAICHMGDTWEQTDVRCPGGYVYRERQGACVATSQPLLDAIEIARRLRDEYPGWNTELDDCPCRVEDAKAEAESGKWSSYTPLQSYHPGAVSEYRSSESRVRTYPPLNKPTDMPRLRPGQQCVYDAKGDLINYGAGAGTPDAYSPEITLPLQGAPSYYGIETNSHTFWDVRSSDVMRWEDYQETWVPNRGKDPKTGKVCPINTVPPK